MVFPSKLLGTREWFIIHHTDCGMATFTNEITTDLLKHSRETATVDSSGWCDTGAGPGSPEESYINWLTIPDNARSVVEDVTQVRRDPLAPANIPIYSNVYDCKTGQLIGVSVATATGAKPSRF